MYTEIIGYLASLFIIVAFIPQTYQVIKTKKVRDVSLGTFSILTMGSVLFIIYGVMIGDMPIILTNAVTICCQGTIVFYKLTLKD